MSFWRLKYILGTIVLSVAAVNAGAQNDFFSEIEVDVDDSAAADEKADEAFGGFIRQTLAYGISEPDPRFSFARDSAGLTQIQTDIFGEYSKQLGNTVKAKLAGKVEANWLEWDMGKQRYRPNNERFFLKDAYLDYTPSSSLWLRAGHQVFAWGESEGLAVIDVLSPRDLREPGQAELRDIREPVPAVLLSKSFDAFTLSGAFTYLARENRYANRNEEFYPFVSQDGFPGSSLIGVDTADPEKEWEFALRLDYQFAGGDLALIAADVNDKDLVVSSINLINNRVTLQQERQQVFGLSVNRVRGSWLLKTELADFTVEEKEVLVSDKDQYRGMLGLEYSGVTDVLFSFEVNATHYKKSPSSSLNRMPRDSTYFGGVARIRHSAINARWINQLWLLSIAQQGDIVRFDSTWEWSDALELGLSLTFYESAGPDEVLYPYRNNDSVEASVRWNF